MNNALKFYIDGQWTDALSGNTLEVIDPSTEQPPRANPNPSVRARPKRPIDRTLVPRSAAIGPRRYHTARRAEGMLCDARRVL